MIVFTLSARRWLERSFVEFGGDRERAVWRGWVAAHPMVRIRPDSPIDDGTGPMPLEFSEAAVDVLRRMSDAMVAKKRDSPDEDEVSDLDNDLTYVRGIAATIKQEAGL